jgi:hypothetical protein
MIIFGGPRIVGCTTFANALRWQLTSTSTDLQRGLLGPARVSWRGRQLEAELGYRGSWFLPRLEEARCNWLHPQVWNRYRHKRIDSLQRAAGVLFVVDSQKEVVERTMGALQHLADEFSDAGRSLAQLPVLFALNKRDLPSALPMAELITGFQLPICDHIETVATTGLGVAESIDRLLAMIDERRSPLR